MGGAGLRYQPPPFSFRNAQVGAETKEGLVRRAGDLKRDKILARSKAIEQMVQLGRYSFGHRLHESRIEKMTFACKMKTYTLNAVYTSIVVMALGCYANNALAEGAAATSRVDSVLETISASGISIGGDLNSNCTTTSNSICVGTFDWTDTHSNDASVNKGAITMDGYVQQNLVSNVNINTTQGAVAAGANVVGDVIPTAGGVNINMTNNNNASGFIGGF